MREADHPADGRLGDGAIDGAGGDEDKHVGRGAGRHIDRIVADAEAADGEQVVGRRDRVAGHRRRQHDHAVCAGKLIGANLRPMLGKWPHAELRLPVERAEARSRRTSARRSRCRNPPSGLRGICSQCITNRRSCRRAADVIRRSQLGPRHAKTLTIRPSLPGFPSAVALRSSTTIRSGSARRRPRSSPSARWSR